MTGMRMNEDKKNAGEDPSFYTFLLSVERQEGSKRSRTWGGQPLVNCSIESRTAVSFSPGEHETRQEQEKEIDWPIPTLNCCWYWLLVVVEGTFCKIQNRKYVDWVKANVMVSTISVGSKERARVREKQKVANELAFFANGSWSSELGVIVDVVLHEQLRTLAEKQSFVNFVLCYVNNSKRRFTPLLIKEFQRLRFSHFKWANTIPFNQLIFQVVVDKPWHHVRWRAIESDK